MAASLVRVLRSTDDGFADLVRWLLPDATIDDLLADSPTRDEEAEIGDRFLALEAHQNGRSSGGVLAQLHADGTAHCLPPRLQEGVPRSTSTRLLERMIEELVRRRILWVTAHVSPEDMEGQARLAEAEFSRTHDLLVLTAQTSSATGPGPAGGWLLRPYERKAQAELCAIFARTLIATRDFPDFGIDSPIDGVLARFADGSPSRDRWWYFVEREGRTAGCLLLADHRDHDRYELLYMGLVPEFRGLGGGRQLARYALQLAREAGRSHLVAAVDAENDPALMAYASASFESTVRQRVFFRQLTTRQAVSP